MQISLRIGVYFGAICITSQNSSVIEIRGNLLGWQPGELTKLFDGDELVGFLLITATDTSNEVAAVSGALTGDALHIFGIDDDSGGLHRVDLIHYPCSIYTLFMFYPYP